MLNVLKIIFGIILVTMLIVTAKAFMMEDLFKIPADVTRDPWFSATLFDAYCGFITFYCWVFYKETSSFSRIIWFFSIMLLGNIAMSTYLLLKIMRLPPDASMKDLLLRTR
jgi:hypothetical protein